MTQPKHRFSTDSYSLVINDIVTSHRGSAERMHQLRKKAKAAGRSAFVFLGTAEAGKSWSQLQAEAIAREAA